MTESRMKGKSGKSGSHRRKSSGRAEMVFLEALKSGLRAIRSSVFATASFPGMRFDSARTILRVWFPRLYQKQPSGRVSEASRTAFIWPVAALDALFLLDLGIMYPPHTPPYSILTKCARHCAPGISAIVVGIYQRPPGALSR
jgi:hypothetical protein